jgi:mono/diheme cytochrome c family protein
MAATDQNYRNQYGLDVVFAVSSILMLLSVLWMFVQDYNREFKQEQRLFRDVETALAQRQVLASTPGVAEFDKAEQAVALARKKRDEQNDKYESNKARIDGLLPAKERIDQRVQMIKAELDSIKSFYDIESERAPSSPLVEQYRKQVEVLDKRLEEAQKEQDRIGAEITAIRRENDRIEAPLTEALAKLKQVTDKFDAQIKTAVKKQWGFGDWFRSLPIIDGFASAYKIQQFTIEDVPIDYNFKYAIRFDRCTTCHLGIDRPAYTREALSALSGVSEDQNAKLTEARGLLEKRAKSLTGLPEERQVPGPDELNLQQVPKDALTPARISQFCAHPRLDLYVGANSKHPAERFGCTSCHSGQGSATSFNLASHTPNDSTTEEHWKKAHGWESNHYWDFPMLPVRFVESSCLKCHHEVTDLISSDNRPEAPKLLRGYNIIREFGCFGCHEINGRKKGRPVGPDLRLENYPPLEEVTVAERTRIEADFDTRPGIMRKVGPSLFRISEKSNPEWTAKWIRSPRGFRPDTKMPHFYGLSNNDPALKDRDTLPKEQEEFPDAEIQAITYYLFQASRDYVKNVAERHKDSAAVRQKEERRLEELAVKGRLNDAEKKELEELRARIMQRKAAVLHDQAPGYKGDAQQGRLLFSEKGCLACHTHEGTYMAQGKAGDKFYAPRTMGEAQFGPNLSQVTAKLGARPGDKESARIWLIQWLLDPHVHSPRSRMPVTHLTSHEAADIAAWILSQTAQDMGKEWETLTVKEPDFRTLQDLSEVYLVRLLSASNRSKLRTDKALPEDVAADLPKEEKALVANYNEHGLKMYLGRKAIGRMGCYACHDIPGFESAKPIGVELNDWGKKDPTKLAFEDIMNFVDKHFKPVDRLTDKDGKPVAGEKGKPPYERFFYDLLTHHQREGFLYQKLIDPRSYDYKRIRAWDDRARMPQFRFARARKKADETDEDFEARAGYEEAQAREAVMTFILGLVAEPIPFKSVYQPTGDRLAEVKGRQVIDKYNCAGCHQIRPGYLEIKSDDDTVKSLQDSLATFKGQPSWMGDHPFINHHNWVGANPLPNGNIQAMGVRGKLMGNDDDAENPYFVFTLSHAMRFKGTDEQMHDIRSAYTLRLPARSMVYPPPEALKSDATLQTFLQDHGPLGGTFADLLVKYLIDKDVGSPEKRYSPDQFGDSSNGRIAVPPLLVGQGERTQGEWLFRFLLDPTPVRRMTVLRMPKFNMSKDEARALVEYFAAVERIINPGTGLEHPFETIQQQEDLNSEYWRNKASEYVDRLKQVQSNDDKGRLRSLYDQRREELLPIWEQILKDYEGERQAAKAKYEAAAQRLKSARQADDKVKETLGKEQDPAKKKSLEESASLTDQAAKDAEKAESAWGSELKRLEALVKENSVQEQERAWRESDVYVTDGFKLLANPQLCLGCHQVGVLQPTQKLTEGPPLHLASKRLRPGWLQRFLASPQKFLTYNTVMPSNFPATAKDLYPQWCVGTPLEQVTAIRDVLMMYPRASALPVNRYWALPMIGEKK